MIQKLQRYYVRISASIIELFQQARLTEHTFMIILAVVIGVLAGLSAVGIRWLIREISYLSFPGGGDILTNIANSPWYAVVFIPILGGLLVGPLIYFLAPEAKGHGVPEVMEAILLKGGKIRPRVAAIKAFASAVTIGSGGSVGREGPIIQIGSSLGSTIGQFFRVSPTRMKTLVGCGAAAGIAAAFNTPIAGALFAVEIILMDFAFAQFSPIVISSVLATVVSHMFEGNIVVFPVPPYELASPYELIFYAILGLLSGVVSFLFIKSLYFAEDFFDYRFKIPGYLKPAVGGIGMGLIGLAIPQVMGVGYESISNALYGSLAWDIALVLIFVKILATSLTLGSGGSGGIFSPSLFMGAMLGLFFGSGVHLYFPQLSATPGAYALVAMGGLVAGTTRAPITAIIIVFELTNDYDIILPLMITCILSTLLSSALSRESIYTLKLILRKIGVKEGMETNIMNSITVKDVYTAEFDSIRVNDNLDQVVKKVIRGRKTVFPVVDTKNHIRGLISLHDVKDYFFDREALRHVLIAGDFATKQYDVIRPDETMFTALQKLRIRDIEGLPVVDEKDPTKILGMIWRKDLQDAYQTELERREITSNLASQITLRDTEREVRFMQGYSIVEITPPRSFIGKSIRQLNIRAKYGVDVLTIKSKSERGGDVTPIPSPDYVITKQDTLVVAGEVKKISKLRNMR